MASLDHDLCGVELSDERRGVSRGVICRGAQPRSRSTDEARCDCPRARLWLRGGWDWETRIVIGAEPQRVPAVGAIALWLRAGGDAVAYPLRTDGASTALDSTFELGTVSATFDPYAAARVERGALVVSFPTDDGAVYPGERPFATVLEVEVVPGTVERIELAPVVDPCAEARREDTALIVSGFVLRVVVQTYCSEFAV
jgi:hypothetical protein